MKTSAIVGSTVVVVAVVAGAIVAKDFWGNTDTTLKLAGSACTIETVAADKDVTVKKGKKITWTIHNACATAQMVSVGNFRVTLEDPANPPVTNCKAGIPETVWPFKPQDLARRSAYIEPGGTEEIVLKDAKNDEGTQINRYFDICLGAVKKDPRLIIDP